MKVKNCVPEEKKKAIACQVPCKDCCKLYTGESIGPHKVRLAEHTRAVQKSDVNNGIAVNVADTNHSSAWANAKMVKKILRYWERRARRSHPNQEESGVNELWTVASYSLVFATLFY